MSRTEITRRDRDTPFERSTDEGNLFVLKRFKVEVLELEGMHFHFDSAVLLPKRPEDIQEADDVGTEDDLESRVTPVHVIASVYDVFEEHPEYRLLVTGHADRAGKDDYNVTLTEQRANHVVAILMGDKAAFKKIAKDKNKVEDYQLICKWAAQTRGYDCDPGDVDGVHGDATGTALAHFKRDFNNEFGTKLAQTRFADDDFWDCYFKLFELEVARLQSTIPELMPALREKVTFFDDGKRAVGCGENFPVEQRELDGLRSAENRRVELCFFPPGHDPVLDCHPGKGKCNAAVCEVNDTSLFEPKIIPIDPDQIGPFLLKIKLLENTRLRLNVEYRLGVKDKTIVKTTGEDGAIEEMIPHGVTQVTLTCADAQLDAEFYIIDIFRRLPSTADPLGQAIRLVNLGYMPPEAVPSDKGELEAAFRMLQVAYDQPAKGDPTDPEAQQLLKDVHGS